MAFLSKLSHSSDASQKTGRPRKGTFADSSSRTMFRKQRESVTNGKETDNTSKIHVREEDEEMLQFSLVSDSRRVFSSGQHSGVDIGSLTLSKSTTIAERVWWSWLSSSQTGIPIFMCSEKSSI
ncbi:hypothetical protein TNCV_909371 [Trichonephila clavipes]|nr:hypothetical protein TNCV_909371 [Trichonephila clavipes]